MFDPDYMLQITAKSKAFPFSTVTECPVMQGEGDAKDWAKGMQDRLPDYTISLLKNNSIIPYEDIDA